MYAIGFGHNLELKYIIQHLEFLSACTITEHQVHVLHNPAMLGDLTCQQVPTKINSC